MATNLIDELDAVEKKSLGLTLDIGALEGLKKMPVDVFEGVYLGEAHEDALILCLDVRNFSSFLCSHKDGTVFRLITEFTSNLLSCINQFGYGCSYYKLLGDGAIVIWDKASGDTISEALFIFDSYTAFLNEDLFRPYEKIALAGALVSDKVFKYEISAELSELKYRDYVGYGINLACRLQNLAGANELVLNEALAVPGGVPFRVNAVPKLQKDLLLLKGIKEGDRKRVLFYDR